jgi:metal-sulfur cluster biosynthetic enzyme
MLTKKAIEQALDTVLDPELGISVVQMGLIYGIKLDKKGNVSILMTLTMVGCPLAGLITESVREKVSDMDGVTGVRVDLTFDPAWTADRMSKKAKKQLGLY